MMHELLQRLRMSGTLEPAAPRARGTTVVREEPGSGTGAVLFQPYSVTEFVPDREPGKAGPVTRLPAPPFPAEGDADVAAEVTPVAGAVVESGQRAPNPVADEWRHSSPDVFRGVARRFCARAPKAAHDLRTWCLQGDRQKVARLAETLKPTLNLFDLSAGDAAARAQAAASGDEPPGSLAYAVLAFEHEIWRVAAAWQEAEGAPGDPAGETS